MFVKKYSFRINFKKEENFNTYHKYIHTCDVSLWKKHSTKGIIINIRKEKKKKEKIKLLSWTIF